MRHYNPVDAEDAPVDVPCGPSSDVLFTIVLYSMLGGVVGVGPPARFPATDGGVHGCGPGLRSAAGPPARFPATDGVHGMRSAAGGVFGTVSGATANSRRPAPQWGQKNCGFPTILSNKNSSPKKQ